MNKVILLAIAVACLAGFTMGQQIDAPIQDEYNKLFAEWIELNNGDKEVAYSAIEGLYAKIRVEFPMGAALAAEVAKIGKQSDETLMAKVIEMGYTEDTYKEAFDPSRNPRADELHQLSETFNVQQRALTAAYQEEFRQRYQQSCMDAIRRLMENAETMK